MIRSYCGTTIHRRAHLAIYKSTELPLLFTQDSWRCRWVSISSLSDGSVSVLMGPRHELSTMVGCCYFLPRAVMNTVAPHHKMSHHKTMRDPLRGRHEKKENDHLPRRTFIMCYLDDICIHLYIVLSRLGLDMPTCRHHGKRQLSWISPKLIEGVPTHFCDQ